MSDPAIRVHDLVKLHTRRAADRPRIDLAAPLEVRRRISVVLQETAVELFLTVRAR